MSVSPLSHTLSRSFAPCKIYIIQSLHDTDQLVFDSQRVAQPKWGVGAASNSSKVAPNTHSRPETSGQFPFFGFITRTTAGIKRASLSSALLTTLAVANYGRQVSWCHPNHSQNVWSPQKKRALTGKSYISIQCPVGRRVFAATWSQLAQFSEKHRPVMLLHFENERSAWKKRQGDREGREKKKT